MHGVGFLSFLPTRSKGMGSASRVNARKPKQVRSTRADPQQAHCAHTAYSPVGETIPELTVSPRKLCARLSLHYHYPEEEMEMISELYSEMYELILG